MKKHTIRAKLQTSVPNPPASFTNAMRETLAAIAQEEPRQEAAAARNRISKRRALVYIVAAVLLVASVAIAATLLTGGMFDRTMGVTPENAASITQTDLQYARIGDAEIRVLEAAYDGISLFVSYSIRDLKADKPMGVDDDPSGLRLLTEEDMEAASRLNVGWWVDTIWIDGQPVGMPSMSGGLDVGTETPGEIVYSMLYRLDQENVYLSGNAVEIALPIGERQSLDTLMTDPDSGQTLLPEKGMITFTLDCSIRDQVTELTPNLETVTPRWRARVSSAVFTPIQTYITVDWEVDPGVMDTYIEQNGEGYKDEKGVLLWKYDGVDAVGMELQSLQLVDENGKPVFDAMEGYYGNQGIGPKQAWFTFPYRETLPDALYLAPSEDGKIQMDNAIRIR